MTMMTERSPVRSRRRLRSATEKVECLARFAASGLSAAAFCREMQLSETTFAWWRRQARAADEAPHPTFAPVAVVAEGSVTPSAGARCTDTSLQVTVRWPNGMEALVSGLDPATLFHLVHGVR